MQGVRCCQEEAINTLYVIGNGFDLWHGLPTSYRDFYDFAKSTLDEIEYYYSFNLQDHDPWHDFENALGEFDPDIFLEFYNEVDVTSESFRPKDIYGLEDEITEQADLHVSSIQEVFSDWVSQIEISQALPKMVFPQGSQFITFNYTSTLQSIYAIENSRVLHIHGRVDLHDELIFGHGNEITEQPEFDEDGESTRTMFSEAEGNAMYPLWALQKPVPDVLNRHKEYFTQLNDVDEIVVIGHSLNKIDWPYFTKIANTAIGAKWKIICYNEEEKHDHFNSLVKCSVPEENIVILEYSDLV